MVPATIGPHGAGHPATAIGPRVELDDVPRRVTIGRTVVRHARCTAPAHELAAAGDTLADWARQRGLPERVLAR
jgi:hypothetical protein